METQKVIPCKHCGFETAHEFCCSGCEAAYNLIHQSGSDQYYGLRTVPVSGPVQSKIEKNAAWNVKPISESRSRLKIRLGGIDCSACAWLIERTPLMDSRIIASRFSSADSIVTVDFQSHLKPEEIAEIYHSLGFQVSAELGERSVHENLKTSYLRAGIALGSWISSMHLGLTLVAGHGEYMEPGLVRGVSWFSFVISLPTLLYSAMPFYRNTILSFKTKTLNIDFMVSLSLFFGVGLSLWNFAHGIGTNYFEALNMLVFALLLSRAASSWWEMRAKKQIEESQQSSLSGWLMAFRMGETLYIKTGQMIPADGVVREGSSQVSQAWLTGESTGVKKSIGDQVLAGSVNLSSPLTIEVTASGMNTQVGKLIEDWKSIHPPNLNPESRKWESRFIAFTLLVILTMFGYRAWSTGWDFQYVITLLIVACPCALGIAIPLGYASALSQALKKNYFVQSGDALEKLASVTDIVFDKTGTILSSEDMEWRIESPDLRTAQNIVHALPKYNQHPIIDSLAHMKFEETEEITLTDFVFEAGVGLSFKYNGEIYTVGKPSDVESNLEIKKQNQHFARLIANPKLTHSTAEWFKSLQNTHRVWLSTGDPSQSGNQLGEILGIPKSQVLTSQKPEDKFQLIQKLHSENRKVAMVGDGVNDILAFKEADVRIGMGSQLFQALDNCDIFLRSLPIEKIQNVLSASQRLKRQVVISLLWALIYNGIGFYFIAQGWIGPIVCAVLMPLSSITVSALAFKKKYFVEEVSA